MDIQSNDIPTKAAGIYAGAAAPVAVNTVPDVHLADSVQEREIMLRVHVPEGTGTCPVIVFSHGSLCAAAAYDPLTSFWAGQGFAVVAPLHLDALETPPAGGPPDLQKLLSSRVRDLSCVADKLAEIAALAGAEGRFDARRLGVAGHSFGALTALIKTGLTLRPGEYLYGDSGTDERFVAAVSLSGVGPLPPLTDDAFSQLQLPLLVTGGTLDEGNIGAGPVFPWEWRLSAYALAPAGEKFRLALKDADHYFGGLLARNDRGGAADPDGLACVAAVSTAFMQAFLNQDRAAQEWLQSANLADLSQGRALWEHK